MKRSNFLGPLFALALAIQPAQATISPPNPLYSTIPIQTSGTALQATVSSSSSAGDLIVVFPSSIGAVNITSVVDSQSNSYTCVTGWRSVSFATTSTACYALSAAALVGGTDWIKVTYSVGGTQSFTAISVTGATAIDVAGVATSGGSAAPTVSATTGQAVDIVFGLVTIGSGSTTTVIEDAADGWTVMPPSAAGSEVVNNFKSHWAYKITTSAGTQTYAPMLSFSRNWSDQIIAFSQPSATGVHHGLTTMGSGG